MVINRSGDDPILLGSLLFGAFLLFQKLKLVLSINSTLIVLFILALTSLFLAYTYFKRKALKRMNAPFLGKSKGLSSRFSNYQTNKNIQRSFTKNHQIIFGTPGSGKTFGALYPQIKWDIKKNKFLIIIDPKGDQSFRDAVYQFCVESDREDDFTFISLTHAYASSLYNPLKLGSLTERRDKIISATDWAHPHFQKLAEAKLLKILKENDIGRFIDISRHIPKGENYSGLAADIENINLTEIGNVINHPEALSLLDYYKQNKVLFVSLDVLAFPVVAKSFGRIFLNDVRSLTNHIQSKISPEDRKKGSLYIDEFVSFVSSEFVDLLNKARSTEIKVTLATQSVSDMKLKDRDLLPQIMDSVTNKIILRLSEPESLEYCARLVGTTKTKKHTDQTRSSLLGSISTGTGSMREVEQFLVHPNMIRKLKSLEGFLITQDPYSVNKITFNSMLKHNFSIQYPLKNQSIDSPKPKIQKEVIKISEDQCLI